MKTRRKIIEIDEELCDGCGQCVIACAEGALKIIDGKARVISDNLCDGIGACIGECPTGALHIIEREAEEFDEEAVEKHLGQTANQTACDPSANAGTCPSNQIQNLTPVPGSGPESAERGPISSRLSHWPVQIRLVTAHAPFLKNANLLVLADCVAVAYPNLHQDLLEGKAVMMGCPKFDDVDSYVNKFADVIEQARLNSITIVSMEVPCCSGLPGIVKKGMEIAGREVPLREMVISAQGEILSDADYQQPKDAAGN